MRLRDLGEDRLIAALVGHLRSSRDVLAGAGDDCAVLRSPRPDELLLLKTDCVVEEVHFQPNESPSAIGRKAMARTLSDFAAMAGQPRFALVTLIAPADTKVSWTKELYRGLKEMAARFEVSIVGGETSRITGPVIVSTSACGVVEKNRWVSRAGGKPGDQLFVTGRLGGSLRKKHLTFIPRIAEARWLTRNFRIHAMMDLSDGLGADLPRLARASGVGFEIDRQSLPRTRGCSIEQAINDGEDYELVFAIAPNDSAALEKAWRKKFPHLPLTRIGQFTRESQRTKRNRFHGYVHFQERR